MSSAGTVRYTGNPGMQSIYHGFWWGATNKKGSRRSPSGRPVTSTVLNLSSACGTPHAEGIRPAEAVTLTSLVTDVARIKVAVHRVCQGHTLEMLHAVGNVGNQIPAVRIGQEVVDTVAFRNRTHLLDSVDVVISSRDTQLSVKQTLGNEHQCWGNDHLAGLGSDQQTTLIGPCSDLNHGIFQGGLVQVHASGGAVVVDSAINQGVANTSAGAVVTEQGHVVVFGNTA